jgi:heme oxygenase (mycobilin-producing)
MIKRLVKLTFQHDKTDDFIRIFEESKDKIKAMPGCMHVELLRCTATPNIFFTLSLWQQEDDLNNYRKSVLFESTWAKTKALFCDKPEAWSTETQSFA